MTQDPFEQYLAAVKVNPAQDGALLAEKYATDVWEAHTPRALQERSVAPQSIAEHRRAEQKPS